MNTIAFRLRPAGPALTVPIRLGSVWVVPGLVLAVLVGLLASVLIVAPSEWWGSPVLPPRTFRAVPLRDVLANFERADLLPYGSVCSHTGLCDRPVSVSLWLLTPVRPALESVAHSASVVIEVPWSSHCFGGGHVIGPIRVLPASSTSPPGLRLLHRWEAQRTDSNPHA